MNKMTKEEALEYVSSRINPEYAEVDQIFCIISKKEGEKMKIQTIASDTNEYERIFMLHQVLNTILHVNDEDQ